MRDCLEPLAHEDLMIWALGGGSGIDAIIAAFEKKTGGKYIPTGVPEELKKIAWLKSIKPSDSCQRLIKSIKEDSPDMQCFFLDTYLFLKGNGTYYKAAAEKAIKRFRKFRSEGGYKSTRWGMTNREVKKRFPRAQTEKDGLWFGTKIAGKRAKIHFTLTYDRLTRTIVAFDPAHVSPSGYVRDFEELKALLNKKYGAPTKADVEFADEAGRILGSASLGTAVAIGDARLISVWETPQTRITLACVGSTGRPTLGIAYESLELDAFARRAQTKATLEDL